jgi:hypothetical protein
VADALRWYLHSTIEIRDKDGRLVLLLNQPTLTVECGEASVTSG